MMKVVEAAYRKLLYKLLDIPVHTKYETILLELGLKRAADIINSQKIIYINRIVSEGLNPLGHTLLKSDHEKCLGTSEESIFDEIRRLSEMMNVGDIFIEMLDKDEIKFRVKKWMKKELWRESMKSSLSQTVCTTNQSFKPYHYMTRQRGRAVLLWKAGALRFRRTWKNYYVKRKMRYDCPYPICGSDDTFDHSTQCMFVRTKLRHGPIDDYKIADYVVELHRERLKYRLPLI